MACSLLILVTLDQVRHLRRQSSAGVRIEYRPDPVLGVLLFKFDNLRLSSRFYRTLSDGNRSRSPDFPPYFEFDWSTCTPVQSKFDPLINMSFIQ